MSAPALDALGDATRQALGIADVERHAVVTAKHEAVFRQTVVVLDGTQRTPKLAQGRFAARLLLEQLQADRPLRLMAAMLTGDLVEPPGKRLSKPDIIRVDSQHLKGLHSVVEPARQRYLDGNHALVGGGLLDDAPLVDDAEALTYAFAACANVGCDGRAAQPLEGFVQPLIAVAAGLPVGRDEEVIHREPHGTIPGILSAPVQPLHELADHVNENILVVLGGAA